MSRSLRLQSPYHPTTFLERGVAVPFTTPVLVGARVRASDRAVLELIVPNPAGGKGSYVIPWNGLQGFCTPTLHDRELQERAAALEWVTPGSIRQACQEVAESGYAGPDARSASAQARARDEEAQLVTNYMLLLSLVAQVESRTPDLGAGRSPAVEARARQAIARIAPSVGLPADVIATALEELAAVLKGVSLGPFADQALHSCGLARLVALGRDMERWIETHEDDTAELAELVRATAELTISCARIAIGEARALADRMQDLLARWRSHGQAVASRAARPDWLLDGWEPICLLWQEAEGDAARREALREMAHLVPILPKEVGDWMGAGAKVEASRVFARFLELNEDWRTGLPVLDAVARNERLRALAE